ncbi:MAG: hypothetical protein GY918_14510 [Gammaproteobacteria bacterium]|nr:hypothetical protein [Gammaproteobacteria bacterium]
MSNNTELTLGQLTQISGGHSRKEERQEKRANRKAEREHKKTCPDGKRTSDCPYPVPDEQPAAAGCTGGDRPWEQQW